MGPDGAHHGARDGLPNPRICQTYGHWQDNHNHDPDEFQCTHDREYQGQYNDMGSNSGWRENGVPSRA